MDFGTRYALVGATVIDGTTAPARPDAVVRVRNGRIAEVRDAAGFTPDAGERCVDVAGMWIMPGLIDAHVHLAGGKADIAEQELGLVAEPPLMRAMRSVAQAQAILKRGFTAVRDVSWNGLYLKRLFFERSVPGPKVIACGPGLTRTGGHADMFQYTPEYNASHGPWGLVADGPDEIVKAVRSLLREGADAIKIFASGGDNWAHDRNSDVHYSAAELRAAVEEAHRQTGTIVMCHAENPEAIRMAIEAGVDTIEHGETLDDELAALMAERGVILVPTLQLIANWHRDFIPVDSPPVIHRPHAFLHRDLGDDAAVEDAEAYRAGVIESFARARRAGVPIALGSDTVFEPLTPYGEYSALELRALVEHGMSVAEAIVAATSVAARALGMSHRIGRVAEGLQADLLVLTRDPLSSSDVLYDPTHIHLTLCDGRVSVVDGHLAW